MPDVSAISAPDRKYLRMVLRDNFVRRAISRLDRCSRNAQRQIILKKCPADHSNVPCCRQPWGRCHMGKFSMKITPIPGSFWVKININTLHSISRPLTQHGKQTGQCTVDRRPIFLQDTNYCAHLLPKTLRA